jgi:YD repeat-containing protein
MTDGIGVTTYAYHPIGQLGATQVASVDGPLASDTLTYQYDELGRVTTRAINGAANPVTWTFDALGRATSETNLLGMFSYAFDGPTTRVATVTYPNGQTSAYSYLDNVGDRRLQTIHHRYSGGATLSKFDYTYDAVGNILTWRQQAESDAVTWSYGYDPADQLTSAIQYATDPEQTVRFSDGFRRNRNSTATRVRLRTSLKCSGNLAASHGWWAQWWARFGPLERRVLRGAGNSTLRRFPRDETQVVMYLESFQAFGATRSREPQGRRASFPFLRRVRRLHYAASADRHRDPLRRARRRAGRHGAPVNQRARR